MNWLHYTQTRFHFVVLGTLRINHKEAVEQFEANGFLLELMNIGEEQEK